MHTDGGRSDSVDELVLDWFISQVDSARSRATLMFVAALAVITAAYALADGFGQVAYWRIAIWGVVVLGNLATMYVLAVYQKPAEAIERDVLGY